MTACARPRSFQTNGNVHGRTGLYERDRIGRPALAIEVDREKVTRVVR
jgi:hypothetical protein